MKKRSFFNVTLQPNILNTNIKTLELVVLSPFAYQDFNSSTKC